jgi:hypothetical protein
MTNLVLIRLVYQNTANWLYFKQQKFIAYSFEGLEVQDQVVDRLSEY